MKNTDKTNPAPVDGQDGVPQKTAPSADPTPVAPKKQAPAATDPPVDSPDQADAATPDDKTADEGGAESTGQIPAFDHEHKYNEVVVLPNGKKYRVGIGGRTHPYDDSGELFEMKPFMDDGDGVIRSEDDTIRLSKGDAYKVEVTAFEPDRCEVVRHYWQGGMPLVCPAKTAPEFLALSQNLWVKKV